MTSRRWRAARYGTVAVAGLLALATASACSSGSSSSSSSSTSSSTSAGGSGATTSFPRTETLYTSGSAYGPPVNWNPLDTGAYATGTQGLIYEPLYLYDPLKGAGGSYDPWLATGDLNAGWNSSQTIYTIHVRSGVKWSDGQSLTGADVAYSINLARTNASDPYSTNVSTVANAVANGNTVTVTFKGTPGYTEFTDYLWKAPVLPQHVWSKLPASQIATNANAHPVGTGPMTLDTATSTEVAYQTNPNWWAASALGLSFHFKYLVDVVNSTNAQELSQLESGNIDWSNNFLPGINTLASALGGNGGYSLKFFYQKSPWMLSGNTVWLEPNTSIAPMNNVNFRKAIAYGLNSAVIAQTVYGGIAQPASPTGLLPTLSTYIDKSAVAKYGATYNPALAKQYLAKSGYHGQTITLQVPDGWSDWQQAVQVIAGELQQIGINIQLIYPQAPARQANLTNGTYDLALDNNAGLDSTPWSYFQRVYQLPIQKQQSAQLNWERYSSPTDWNLVQEAGSTPVTDIAKLKSIYSQLEADFLQQEPEIPVWYNGAWFQGNTQHWSDYPANGSSDENMPVMWNGYIGAMTTVLGLANLKPAASAAG